MSPHGVQGPANEGKAWTGTVAGKRTRNLAPAKLSKTVRSNQDGQVNRRERKLTLRTRSRLGHRARLIACSDRATVQNGSALRACASHHGTEHRKRPLHVKARRFRLPCHPHASPETYPTFITRGSGYTAGDRISGQIFPNPCLARDECRRSFLTAARFGWTSYRRACRNILPAASCGTARRNERAALILPTADCFSLQLRVRQRFADLAFHAPDTSAAAGVFHARPSAFSSIALSLSTKSGAPEI